jgi:hypothetical protein
VFAEEVDKFRALKAAVPRLDDLAERAAIDLARQEVEERRKVGFVELFGRRELPQDRPEFAGVAVGSPD